MDCEYREGVFFDLQVEPVRAVKVFKRHYPTKRWVYQDLDSPAGAPVTNDTHDLTAGMWARLSPLPLA